jgi:amino acid transporter
LNLPHKLPLPETQALPRCLGVVGALFLTLSAASPASSVFIIVPGMLQSAGSGTLWAFLLASVVCVSTAYVYAELSAAFPLTGGEYVMVGHIHPRLQSPWIATVAMGFIGTLCCFVSLPFLLIVSGGGLIVTYAAIAIAALIGRRGGATAHSQYRMPLFPAAPIVTLIALVGVLYANWQDVEEGRPALLATAAQIVLAAAYYWLVLRPRGWTANATTS